MADTLFTSGTVVQSSWLNDVDRNTYNILASVAGTNTITATGPQPMVAYQRGIRLWFTPVNTNTGATTLNISGLGAKNVTKYGTQPLLAGDLVTGVAALIFYDGVQFQVVNPQSVNVNEVGRLINTQVFTANGTYTPTAGTTSVIVEAIGGGGSGGGSVANSAAQISGGGGGGCASYARARYTSGFSGVSVVIGTGGAGVATSGTAGTATTFGGLLSAPGGNFGAVLQISTATVGVVVTGGPVGSAPTGSGIIVGVQGAIGGSGFLFGTGGYATGGVGANSMYGSGGAGGGGGAGAAGTLYGSGGGGGSGGPSAAAFAGGAGRNGILIVYEYS